MTQDQFKARTKAFAVEVLKLCDQMPTRISGQVVARQLARCGTSVAANYRAACRARSRAECAAKLGIVEEEADEALLWLEISEDVGLVRSDATQGLAKEAGELLAMTVASIKTIRKNLGATANGSDSQSTACDPPVTDSVPQSAIPSPQSAAFNPQSAVSNPQSAIRNPLSNDPRGGR